MAKEKEIEKKCSFVLESPGLLFEILAAIAPEMNIRILESEIALSNMHPNHSLMAIVKIPKEKCELVLNGSKQLDIGISVRDLSKILKYSSGFHCHFNFNFETNMLEISMKKNDEKKVKKHRLRSIDSTTTIFPYDNLLKITFPVEIIEDKDILKEIVKEAEIYTDMMSLDLNDERLLAKAEGSIGEFEYEIERSEIDYLSKKEDATIMLTIEYLKNTLKLSSKTFHIKFGKNTPLRIDGLIDEYGCTYFIAPRVADDETESYEENGGNK